MATTVYALGRELSGALLYATCERKPAVLVVKFTLRTKSKSDRDSVINDILTGGAAYYKRYRVAHITEIGDRDITCIVYGLTDTASAVARARGGFSRRFGSKDNVKVTEWKLLDDPTLTRKELDRQSQILPEPTPTNRTKWEVMAYREHNSYHTLEGLNKLGDEGWKVCGSVYEDHSRDSNPRLRQEPFVIWYLTRPK